MLPGPDSRRLERLGEYAIHRVIGEGGMGIVYEATERLSGRRVALKVLHSSLTKNEGARDRFFSEMRIMSELEHPNIVRSLSSAEIEGKLVMVLEYLEGRTLREELEVRGRLPLGLTTTVASAVASALGAAHGARVVHRDLKPENVMLAADGRVKVMDFGIAKVLGSADTHTTQAVGTVKYMSPEQAGGGVISPQTDLYALGLLIFEMLTGRAPFESTSLLAILRHHCETPAPPLPEDVRREVPPALEQLLFQLLEKDPLARPDGALPVLNALIALAGPHPAPALVSEGAVTPPRGARGKAFPGGSLPGGSKAPAPDTIALILRLDQKPRWKYVVGLALALAVVAVIVGIVVHTESAQPERRVAGRAPAGADAPITPTLAPAAGCRAQDICFRFTPANPTAVAAEAIIAEGDQLARRLDPRATLVTASFMGAMVDGLIDVTRDVGRATLLYALPEGSVMVSLKGGGFVASKMANPPSGDPLTPATCPLKRAWEVAFGPGLRTDSQAYAMLAFNPALRGPGWVVSTGKESLLVNATTCVLVSSRAR